MIKVFKASKMSYTPFDNFEKGDIDFLCKNGIIFTDSVRNADIIVSDHIKYLKKYYYRYLAGRKLL